LAIFVERNSYGPLLHLATVSVTCGFWAVSLWLGAGGEVVYYVRKLIWTSNAIGVLVSGSAVVLAVMAANERGSLRVFRALPAISLVVSLFVLGSNPFPRFSFVKGDWFVSQLMSDGISLTHKSVALNPQDRFTTHLANVALTAVSDVAHEFDLALLGDASISELCGLAEAAGVDQILTTKTAVPDLVSGGCKSPEFVAPTKSP